MFKRNYSQFRAYFRLSALFFYGLRDSDRKWLVFVLLFAMETIVLVTERSFFIKPFL
ncbi:MAG TPA: hypothetical protein VKR53_19755 [Puia sp.]|nr:hypothetical protein [Puia sp.]